MIDPKHEYRVSWTRSGQPTRSKRFVYRKSAMKFLRNLITNPQCESNSGHIPPVIDHLKLERRKYLPWENVNFKVTTK